MLPSTVRVWSAGVGLFFVFLTVAAGAGFTADVDRGITRAVQVRPAAWLDWCGSLLSVVGSFEVTVTLALVLGALVWQRGDRQGAMALLIVFAALTMAEIVLKAWLHHPGPPPEFTRPAWGNVPSGMVLLSGNSFPSGHAMRCAFLLTAGWRLLPGRGALRLTGAAAIVMAVSRIYVGAHWASDVAGGLALGWPAAVMTLWASACTPWSHTIPVRPFVEGLDRGG